ncbi:MAG: helix-turn-helix domain-containing protein [Alphaproteobacteria bacterium]|nr:helix-turn-helix domain-containing protein [Alphaproteobacteria bacterium]
MKGTTEADIIPAETLPRAAWVQAKLKCAGTSFSDIARDLGVSRQTVAQTMWRPNARIELAIAQAVGVEVTTLFADRFDAAGNRLHRVRGGSAESTPATPSPTRQKAKAA